MRRSQHLRTPANPCLPNAPSVADGEQSASSQPSPSRRKSCPAPAAAEPATTSPQLPRQCTIKPCDPIIANPTPRKAGSTSGGTRASAAAGLAPPPTRPNATLAFAIVQGQSRRWSNAQASGLVRHFYGHQCCAVATAAALVSILAGPATFWSRCACALGVGASRCRLTLHGGNHGQRRQRLSAVLVYGIIRHGDCPRGREPSHLMQHSA
jgi:hypothetical protein